MIDGNDICIVIRASTHSKNPVVAIRNLLRDRGYRISGDEVEMYRPSDIYSYSFCINGENKTAEFWIDGTKEDEERDNGASCTWVRPKHLRKLLERIEHHV